MLLLLLICFYYHKYFDFYFYYLRTPLVVSEMNRALGNICQGTHAEHGNGQGLGISHVRFAVVCCDHFFCHFVCFFYQQLSNQHVSKN